MLLGTIREGAPKKIGSQYDFEAALHGVSDGQIFVYQIKGKDSIFGNNYSKEYAQCLMKKHKFDNLADTYISVNTFWGKNKDTSHLKRICALFSDVDCRTGFTPEQTLAQIRAEVFAENILPQPSIVVFSGRGLHFYWLLKNEDRKALPSWNVAQRDINNKLKPYGADGAAMDAARIMRLPFTINSRNKTRADVWEYSPIEYRLNSWLKEMGLSVPVSTEKRRSSRLPSQKQLETAKKLATSCNMPVPHIKSDWEANLFIKDCISKLQDTDKSQRRETGFTSAIILKKKIADLVKLTQLRKCKDCYRENILFLGTVWTYSMSHDPIVTKEYINELNNQFECPLSLSEAEKTVRVAINAMDRGVYYHFRNTTVLRFLHISSEEQKELEYFTEESINQRIAYRNMTKKEKDAFRYRNKLRESGKVTRKEKKASQLKELHRYLCRGFSPAQVCKIMDISRSTYYRLKNLLLAKGITEYKSGCYLEHTFLHIFISFLSTYGVEWKDNSFSPWIYGTKRKICDFLSLALSLHGDILQCKSYRDWGRSQMFT